MPSHVRYRLALAAVLVVAFLLVDGWLDRAEGSWAEYAAQGLFMIFFMLVVVISWPWVTRIWQRTAANDLSRGAQVDARARGRWRLAFLLALFTTLAAPLLCMLVTWGLGSVSIASVGVPLLLLTVLSLYAVAYRPVNGVVSTYAMGSAVLLFVAYLIWNAVLGVLSEQGGGPGPEEQLWHVPIAWILLPFTLMVLNIVRGIRRRDSPN